MIWQAQGIVPDEAGSRPYLIPIDTVLQMQLMRTDKLWNDLIMNSEGILCISAQVFLLKERGCKG